MKSQVIIKKPEETNLYLLLKVGDNGGEKLVLVSLPCQHHIDILEEYQKSLKGQEYKSIKVLDSGIFILEEESKKIINYVHASERFKDLRYPSASETIEDLLKRKYPDYSIETGF